MSEAVVDATVTRTLIVLPRAVWEADFTAELMEKAGLHEEQARRLATKIISRVCKHHGYLDLFMVDDREPELVKDQPESRGRPKSDRPGGAGTSEKTSVTSGVVRSESQDPGAAGVEE